MNGSLKECVKSWLRGSMDDITTAGEGGVEWTVGIDGGNVWFEKWTVKSVAGLYRRL